MNNKDVHFGQPSHHHHFTYPEHHATSETATSSTDATEAVRETTVAQQSVHELGEAVANKPAHVAATVVPNQLASAVQQTKASERTVLFNTYKKAKEKCGELPADLQQKTAKALQHKSLDKLYAAIQNSSGVELSEETKKRIGNNASSFDLTTPGGIKELCDKAEIPLSSDNLQVVAEKMKQESIDPKKAADEAKKLTNLTQKLASLLTDRLKPKETQAQRNAAILSTLRQAFQSPAYQHLKEDESNAAIRLLHTVNLAGYLETPLIDAYEPISEAMLGKETMDKMDTGMSGTELTDTLKNTRNDAGRRGVFKSDKCFKFFKEHFRIAFGAFQSQKFGPSGYDPRGSLENATGGLYEKHIQIKNKQSKVTTVYTPSPTIDNEVSPEFRAVLQAMQNSKLKASGAPLDRPKVYLYTNLQDINKSSSGENGRSIALMKLNAEFPHVARFKTLTKDSAFYKEGVGHEGAVWDKIEKPSVHSTYFEGVLRKLSQNEISKKDAEALCKAFNTGDNFEDRLNNFMHKQKELGYNFNEEDCRHCLDFNMDYFFSKFQSQLLDDANFTLKDRSSKAKGGGYYFPGGKAAWETPMQDILAKAKVYTEEKAAKMTKPITGRDAWELQALAKEFVYTAIQRYDEAQSAVDADHIVVTSACKENIDRGGCETAKSLWLMGRSHLKEAVAAYFTRPIAAKFRIILEDRVQPFHAVLKLTDNNPDEFNLRTQPVGVTIVEGSVRTIRETKPSVT